MTISIDFTAARVINLGVALAFAGQGARVAVSGAAGNFPARAGEMSPKAFKTVVDMLTRVLAMHARTHAGLRPARCESLSPPRH